MVSTAEPMRMHRSGPILDGSIETAGLETDVGRLQSQPGKAGD